MNSGAYLDRLLLRYSGTFDIYRPYRIRDREYSAYGYFFSHMEKYVLVREINMWSADSYEHILFIERDRLTEKDVEEGAGLIRDYMEPELVRRGGRYPEKNHMYSYLTVVFISGGEIDRHTGRKVSRFFFDKGYKFNLLGYSQGRMLAVDLERERVVANRAARSMIKLYRRIFEEERSGKPGQLKEQLEEGLT